MKYNLYANQKAAFDLGLDTQLDIIDLIIFDFIWNFSASTKARKFIEGENTYVWIKWNLITENIPMLPAKKRRSVFDRMKKLETAGLIQAHSENQKNASSYYCLTKLADNFVFEGKREKQAKPVQQNAQPCAAECTPPMQLDAHYYTNSNNTINNNNELPTFSKNEKTNSNTENQISLNENDVCLKTKMGATLNNKVTDPKELDIETNQNNNLKPTETTLESTNASKAICLYSEVAKMSLNSYNEISNRNYTFQRHGEVIIKRLKKEFTKEQIQAPQTFELIKTMLEVKWNDTVPDQKGFALLPIRNYEPITLFSPSKFATYLQAAENTLTEKQSRKQKAAENKKTNIFDSII